MPRKNDRSREIDLKLASATAGGDPPSGVVPPTAAPAIPNQPAPTGLAVASNTILFSAVTPMALVGLTWNAPPGTPPAFYVVEYATNSTFTTNLQRVHAYQTSAGIELPANTLYYFRVQGVTNFVASAYSSTVSVTTAADSTAAGQPTSIASDWSGADLVITWVNPSSANLRDVEVRIWNDSGKGVLYHTGYNSAGRYTWTIEQQRIDTSGSLDPSVFFELRSRTWANTMGTAPTGSTVTNATPSAPSAVSFIQAPGSITITVSATPPADFAAYRYRLIQTLPSASDVTWDSPSALGSYSIYAQATYQVGVKVLDVFGQLSSETLSSATIVDSLTISALRADVVYSDNDGNSDSTLHIPLSNATLTSGGITYATTSTWNKWIRAERPLMDRYRTLTLSMTAASGTSSWYIRLSQDASTWVYFAGPIVGTKTLTSVANAAAAQAAPVSAASLGGQTTSKIELPSTVEARFVEVWIRNPGPANTRVDEFYPRRAVEADDIYVQNLSGISADLGTITAGTITGATIQTTNGYTTLTDDGIQLEASSTAGGLADVTTISNRIKYYYTPETFEVGGVWVQATRLGAPVNIYQNNLNIKVAKATQGGGTGSLILTADTTSAIVRSTGVIDLNGDLNVGTSGTPKSANVAGGVNVGTASGAGTGEIRTAYSVNGSGASQIRNTNSGGSAYGALYIGNNTDVTSGIIRNSSANAGYAGANSLSLIHVGAYPIGFVTSNTLRMTIGSGGEVAIGRAPVAGVRLIVQGSGTSSATYGFNVKNSAGTDILSTRDDGLSNIISSAWSSDARHKEHIRSIDDSDLARFRQLEPRHYIRTNGPGGPEYGLIAQHTQCIFPELIFTDQEGFLSIRYTDTIPLLMAEVQLLRARLDVLEAA